MVQRAYSWTRDTKAAEAKELEGVKEAAERPESGYLAPCKDFFAGVSNLIHSSMVAVCLERKR